MLSERTRSTGRHARSAWAACVLLAGAAVAQGTDWSLRRPTRPPLARNSATMAFDPLRGVTVLYGGVNRNKLLTDIWEWDGCGWSHPKPAPGPSALSHVGLAWDGVNHAILCFEYDDKPAVSRTWLWDGRRWNLSATPTHPQPRTGAFRSNALVYDSARKRVVLVFGNWNAQVGPPVCDTWEWDGKTWTQRKPRVSPPARSEIRGTLAYDDARRRVVLFGGWKTTPGPFWRDTWEWDGTNWTEVHPRSSPSARASHGMVYDSRRRVVVLFGGTDSQRFFNDTWEWNGSTWTKILPKGRPSGRTDVAMAYDARRGRIVLFGGFDRTQPLGDTWEYHRLPAASFALFGKSCGPKLSYRCLPILGASFTVHLRGAPPLSPGWLLFGVPPRLSLSLPNGCWLYVNPFAMLYSPTLFTGSWDSPPIGIPNQTSLAGVVLLNQFFMLRLRPPPLRILTSHGGQATIGF